MAIDCKTAALTVSTVEPATPLSVTLIVDVPVATPVAKPCDLAESEIVATEGVAETHVTWLVRFCVELSEYVPIAVNCWVPPLGTVGLAGETAIDRKTAALTVSTVEPATPLSAARDRGSAQRHAGRQALRSRGVRDRGHGRRGRNPRHLACHVLRRVVGVRSCCGELLGSTFG